MEQITHYVTVTDNDIVQTDEIESIIDENEESLDIPQSSLLDAITDKNKNKERADIVAIFEYISKTVANIKKITTPVLQNL